MLDMNPPVVPPPLTRVLKTPGDAREAVREYAAAGYDLIKVRASLTLPVYDPVIAEAKAAGIVVDGHVPRGAGMSIEHVLSKGRGGIAHLEEFVYAAPGMSDSAAQRLTELAASSGVYVTSTLTVFPTILAQQSNLDSVLNQPEVKTLNPLLVNALWRRPNNPYVGGGGPDSAWIRRALTFQRQLARRFVDAGVPLMAGSDALNPAILPGSGLWNELRELTKSGLSNFEALRTATALPARYVPQLRRTGVLTKGSIANLALYEKNPLEDIGNLGSLTGVMVNGRWLVTTR
jgi:hypothetical protein